MVYQFEIKWSKSREPINTCNSGSGNDHPQSVRFITGNPITLDINPALLPNEDEWFFFGSFKANQQYNLGLLRGNHEKSS
jgi:hypothetical protein